MGKIEKLNRDIARLEAKIEKLHQEIEEAKERKERKELTPAEYTQIKQKNSLEIKHLRTSIRRKEKARYITEKKMRVKAEKKEKKRKEREAKRKSQEE